MSEPRSPEPRSPEPTSPPDGPSGLGPGPSVPRPFVATYRLQARGEMDLVEACSLLPYLAALGVSHAYLSPVLQARTGSTHGYDVVDPHRADETLGGDAAFAAFAEVAHERDLGVVLDIVPNHMAADPDHNAWWRDVLRNGRASRWSQHFDITWDPPDRKLSNQVLLPILGDHYGRVLDRGELRLERDGAELQVRYFERTFPLEPRSTAWVLQRAATASGSASLALVARVFEDLLPAGGDGPEDLTSRQRRADVGIAARVLQEAVEDERVAAALDAELDAVNDDRDAQHSILELQHYRLARWQTGSQEIDYRRFFDITDLVGVRVEDPVVFADTHERIGRWVDEGLLDGLRVDHPDGLADPARYCEDLRALAGDRWIVVEKILEDEEQLAPWPVDGTTGYEFATAVNRLFVAADGHQEIRAATAEILGIDPDFAALVRTAKLDVLHNELAAELRRLTDRLVALCEQHSRSRDFVRRELQETLAITLACLPVYRTYVTATGGPSDHDRQVIDVMIKEAQGARPDLDPDLFTLVQRALLAEAPFDDAAAAALRQRFQQVSGAVMAKGKEDTALYRYPVLLAVNEVGADPGHPTATIGETHAFLGELARHRPQGMLTLSTHDTKRSEDVRARLDVLSELPGPYLESLRALIARHAPDWGGVEPDALALVVGFQTAIGAHPINEDRQGQYAEKAAREAGLRTSWVDPDEDFEGALRRVLANVASDPRTRERTEALVQEVLADGRVNSLAQRLLLLTAPGIPDLYQGSELWDLSLVDPDNRRPVDFDQRVALLAATQVTDPEAALPGAEELGEADDPGTAKIALTARALAVRRAHPQAFGPAGGYRPILADGPAADHLFAFMRGEDIIVAVPRLGRTRRDRGGWGDTTLPLPGGRWVDTLSPERSWSDQVRAEELLAPFPVALLRRETR